MAIGKISGAMLFDNLERLGTDLRVDTDLVYFDVTNRRLGINNTNPQYSFDNPGNVRIANLIVLGDSITSETGNIYLGSNANVKLGGGTSYDVLYTDGDGNLAWGTLSEISTMDDFTGNTIDLGWNTLGSLSNALTLSSTTSVTDAIALLNELLGNITDPLGQTIHVVNVDATNITGTLLTNSQPNINTLGTLTGLDVVGNVEIQGNLLVEGNSIIIGATTVTILDPTLDIHTFANLAPLTSNDGYDIGITMHYYDYEDSVAFLGRSNDTGFLEWYPKGTEGQDHIFSGNVYGTFKTGEILLVNSTSSTTTTSGALVVTGGVGIGGNLNVAGNITVPHITTNTIAILSGDISGISGNIANIGNITIANTSISSPQVINFYSGETAIRLPVGSNLARPSSPSTGTIRFNSDLNVVEYYNGGGWISINSAITGQNFFGDGSNSTFPLNQNTTTLGVLVSINGTIQEPDIAYSVSGNQLTFVEIPEATDRIDVRYMVSTITASLNSAIIDVTPREVGTSPITIDLWPISDYRSAKYTISSKNPFDAQMSEVLVIHDGTNSFVSATDLRTGSNSLLFSTSVSSGNVIVQATGTTANNQLRVQSTYFLI